MATWATLDPTNLPEGWHLTRSDYDPRPKWERSPYWTWTVASPPRKVRAYCEAQRGRTEPEPGWPFLCPLNRRWYRWEDGMLLVMVSHQATPEELFEARYR